MVLFAGFDHRLAEPSRDGLVIGQAARAGAFVAAPFGVLLEASENQAQGRVPLTDPRGGQHVPDIGLA